MSRLVMWWTVPAPSSEVPYGDRCDRITSGSHRHASHHDRFGYRQKRVSSSRDRRGREGGLPPVSPEELPERPRQYRRQIEEIASGKHSAGQIANIENY